MRVFQILSYFCKRINLGKRISAFFAGLIVFPLLFFGNWYKTQCVSIQDPLLLRLVMMIDHDPYECGVHHALSILSCRSGSATGYGYFRVFELIGRPRLCSFITDWLHTILQFAESFQQHCLCRWAWLESWHMGNRMRKRTYAQKRCGPRRISHRVTYHDWTRERTKRV